MKWLLSQIFLINNDFTNLVQFSLTPVAVINSSQKEKTSVNNDIILVCMTSKDLKYST